MYICIFYFQEVAVWLKKLIFLYIYRLCFPLSKLNGTNEEKCASKLKAKQLRALLTVNSTEL